MGAALSLLALQVHGTTAAPSRNWIPVQPMLQRAPAPASEPMDQLCSVACVGILRTSSATARACCYWSTHWHPNNRCGGRCEEGTSTDSVQRNVTWNSGHIKVMGEPHKGPERTSINCIRR